MLITTYYMIVWLSAQDYISTHCKTCHLDDVMTYIESGIIIFKTVIICDSKKTSKILFAYRVALTIFY